jgi:hypothetical protein
MTFSIGLLFAEVLLKSEGNGKDRLGKPVQRFLQLRLSVYI